MRACLFSVCMYALVGSSSAHAAVLTSADPIALNKPVYIGGSLMGGARSSYIYRGRKLGRLVVESQAAFGVSLENDWCFEFEADWIRGWKDDDFSHSIVSTELTYYLTDHMTLGGIWTRNWFDGTALKSGMEYGLHWTWSPSIDWQTYACGLYDDGANGWFGEAGVIWQPLIAQGVAWQTSVALEASSHCYGAGAGVRTWKLRSGPLLQVGKFWKIQPYVSFYQGLRHGVGNFVAAGVWVTWAF